MSDILTRLLLDTSQFNANLNGAKHSVNNYQGGIASMAKTAGAGIAKFAGGIGLAVGAGETFIKIIRSSQATSDEFDNCIYTCKSTVDSFFSSLATGDFTSFTQGIDDIMSKAYAASSALDQLGNTRMAYKYFDSETQAKIAENSLVARDKGATKSEREKGFSGWDSALGDKRKTSETMKTDALDALIKTVVEGTVLNAKKISLKDFENITKLDLQSPEVRSKKKAELENSYDTYKIRYNDLESRKQSGGIVDWAFPNSNDAKDRAKQNGIILNEQRKLNEEYKESILYKKILDKWSDEELQKAFNLASEYQNVKKSIDMDESTYRKAHNKFLVEKDASTDGKKPKEIKLPPPEKSIAELDAKLKEWSKKFNEASTQEARIAAQAMIDSITSQKQTIEFRVKYNISEDELNKALPKSIRNDFVDQSTKHSKTKKKDPFKETEAYKAGVKGMGKFKKKPLFDDKDIKMNEDYATSLNGIANVIGDMTGLFDEDSASVLQWGVNLISTIAQAIPAIVSMFAVKEIDTATTNENTTANVANAGSKVMSAHAGIPFVGIALGIAGIASIAIAMLSMPKFAHGGIVPGSSFNGDKILAGLNSGEMILNGGQQSRLFEAINSGNMGGKVSTTLVSGTAVIRGDDAFLQLSNYMKKSGRRLPR